MPTSDYRTADGKRCPGTTTIIGRFKDSGGLVRWAWKMGMEGKSMDAAKDKAADAGTLGHSMIDLSLRGSTDDEVLAREWPGVAAELVELAKGAFRMYLSWASQTRLEVVSLEEPLVSEAHRFGGTPDALIKIDGKLAIGDWKTSNAIYRDYLLQVAAYRALYEEVKGIKVDGGFHILRVGKETADFEHRYFAELDDAWLMFRHLRQAYDYDLRLKQRVR